MRTGSYAPDDVPEVFVSVDWKTTASTDLAHIADWWENAGTFKNPLCQCLVYRELLQAHFKRMNVEALVGIILVPFHQTDPQLSCPGLCVNFERMLHLLKELNTSQWLAVLDDSIYVTTIKLPCKLFKDSFDPAVDVDESTNVLKGDTRLKDILNETATVADLNQALDLPFLKVEGIKKEEAQKKKIKQTRSWRPWRR